MKTVQIHISLPAQINATGSSHKTIETHPSFYPWAISEEGRPNSRHSGGINIPRSKWKSMKNKAKLAYHVRRLVADEQNVNNPDPKSYSYKAIGDGTD